MPSQGEREGKSRGKCLFLSVPPELNSSTNRWLPWNPTFKPSNCSNKLATHTNSVHPGLSPSPVPFWPRCHASQTSPGCKASEQATPRLYSAIQAIHILSSGTSWQESCSIMLSRSRIRDVPKSLNESLGCNFVLEIFENVNMSLCSSVTLGTA